MPNARKEVVGKLETVFLETVEGHLIMKERGKEDSNIRAEQ